MYVNFNVCKHTQDTRVIARVGQRVLKKVYLLEKLSISVAICDYLHMTLT